MSFDLATIERANEAIALAPALNTDRLSAESTDADDAQSEGACPVVCWVVVRLRDSIR